jgi:HAD superfamily hydrolase (TIGR01509 family)
VLCGSREPFSSIFTTLVTHFDPHWVPPPASIARRLGLEERRFADLWRSYGKAWEAGEIRDYEDALAQVCAAAEKQPDFALFSQLDHERRQAYARPFQTVEPQIMQLLTRLRESGLKLGVITNASNLDAAPWLDCSLAPSFDCFVASHEVRVLKPDRRIYLLACRLLEVSPSEAIFVGDGGSNELQGAADAGLRVYWSTWFLDKWPPGIRPNSFPGDEWRQHPIAGEPPFKRLMQPEALLHSMGISL